MTVLVTGAAGFIGYHVCDALLSRGENVIALDNMSNYYDVSLKRARLARLIDKQGFEFHEVNIADRELMQATLAGVTNINQVVHLAAQAGVRYSIDHPFTYIEANLVGHMVILELCRKLPELKHLVYASSSSVYGANTKLPYSINDRVDHPKSLYAATKRANELMSQSYSHLYQIPQTGLRYFSVYGPWGRPDMAIYSFTQAIYAGEPIQLYNSGDMRRDFTYIDDIVSGTLAALARPPTSGTNGHVPHRVYNLGNHRSEELMDLVMILEKTIGRKADIIPTPMPSADVQQTFADITPAQRDLGFRPVTSIAKGIPRFISWYRDYNGL